MASTIVTKNSSTPAAVPLTGDLTQGELAVNVTDKRLFTKNSGGTVVELGINPTELTVKTTLKLSGSSSGYVALQGAAAAGSTTYTLPSADGTSGQALTTNGTGTLSWATISTAAATPTVLGTVYGKMTASGASPYLTALGYNAGVSTTGASVTAVGTQALYSNTTAANNTAVGYQAAFSETNGNYNTAVGTQALYSQNGVVQNVAVGYQAGYSQSTGTGTEGNSVFVGYKAGFGVTTGYRIVAIGAAAGYSGTALTTGNSCTYVGYGAQASGAAVSGELVLCTVSAVGKGTNTGFISANGSGIYQGGNSSTWLTTSDRRLKKNIVDNNVGLEKLLQIQVRNFEYRLPEEVDPELKPTDAVEKKGMQLGVIAQEFQQVLPDCVRQESTGVLAVDVDNLTWYTINAIKELKAELDAAKAEIALLKGN